MHVGQIQGQAIQGEDRGNRRFISSLTTNTSFSNLKSDRRFFFHTLSLTHADHFCARLHEAQDCRGAKKNEWAARHDLITVADSRNN